MQPSPPSHQFRSREDLPEEYRKLTYQGKAPSTTGCGSCLLLIGILYVTFSLAILGGIISLIFWRDEFFNVGTILGGIIGLFWGCWIVERFGHEPNTEEYQ